jgi:predicted N-acyltransferase
MATIYSHDLAESVAEVNARDWEAVTRDLQNPFLDLRFLRAVEKSFCHEAKFWYAIFRDETGAPVACTCFSRYLVDGGLMSSPFIRRMLRGVRRLWPGFLKFNILLCGVPVSTCNHQLGIAPGADLDRLAPSLEQLAQQLARAAGCMLISFKEFPPELSRRLDCLQDQGFLRARSLTAYHLEGEFGSFEGYQKSRSKSRRAKIRKSFQKFTEAGLTCTELRGRDGVDALFTDPVHRLYLNVLDRAQVKFETVPKEFFQELARQFPDDACFTVIRREEEIVGFCCALAHGATHYMLFCGLNYELNADADLYFNIIYRGLGQGLVPGVRQVHIGAGADEFKQHIGCTGESIAIYVKAVGAVQQFVLRRCFGLLFDVTPDKLPEGSGTPLPAVTEEPDENTAPGRAA